MIKYYAKVFFFTGILFFVGILVTSLPGMTKRQAVIHALASGLLFGVTLALTVGTVHVLKVRKAAGGDPAADIYATTQSRTFRTALEYERLFTAVTHYLSETAGFTLTEKDYDKGRITALSPFNIITFGSRITVLLEKNPGGPAEVKIVSRPRLSTILADYGENLRIVAAFEKHLRAL